MLDFDKWISVIKLFQNLLYLKLLKNYFINYDKILFISSFNSLSLKTTFIVTKFTRQTLHETLIASLSFMRSLIKI